MEHEMNDYTGSASRHRSSNKRCKGKFGALPGKQSTDSLQKTAIPGNSHIIGKVLQCETGSLSGGEQRWFERSTGRKGL
jgi:hypothetical protein